MTSTQFIEKFKLLTEVISSYESPGLLDEEIYDLLNISQKQIVLELCVAKRFDSLYSLVVQEGVTLIPSPNLGGDSSKVFTGSITGDYFHEISAQVAISRDELPSSGFIPTYSLGNSIVLAESIPLEFGLKFVTTPINKNSIFLTPKYWIQGKSNSTPTASITLVLDTYTHIGNFTSILGQPNIIVRYIKIPQNISSTLNTDLPENLHELILTRAVETRNKTLVANSNKN